VPHRGRTNQPAYVTHVVQHLADLRDQPLTTLREATAENARLAFPRLVP
jgi:TatD DNase family protein